VEQRGHRKSRRLLIIFMEKEAIIINWEQFFGTPQNSISSNESRVC